MKQVTGVLRVVLLAVSITACQPATIEPQAPATVSPTPPLSPALAPIPTFSPTPPPVVGTAEPAAPTPTPVAGSAATTGRVREAILSLNKREQIVIRVTMHWYQPEQAHQRLPNDVAAELAATLKTTPENIRQIRRRAMRKLEAYLREHAVRAS